MCKAIAVVVCAVLAFGMMAGMLNPTVPLTREAQIEEYYDQEYAAYRQDHAQAVERDYQRAMAILRANKGD